MEKFDAISIAQYQHYCALLLVLILRIYTGIECMDNNQKRHSNDEKNKLKLGDILFQEILEDQEVT